MRNRLTLRILAWGMLAVGAATGCHSRSADRPAARPEVVWVEDDIPHDDVRISLGYRPVRSDDGTLPHPVARITRDGEPVANAMVFCGIVSGDSGEKVGDEVATEYRSSPAADTGYYVQSGLQWPENGVRYRIRYRIVLPDSEQVWTREMSLPDE